MTQRNPYLVNKTFTSYLFVTILASMALSLGVVLNGIIVGNLLGVNALSSINLSAPLMQLFTALFLLINVGGAILVAKAIGQRKYEEVNRFFSLSMFLSVLVGLLVTIIGIFFLDEVVRLLCSNTELQTLVKEYVRVVLWSAPVYLLLPGLCVYVRADGNPKLASVALIAANLINVGLTLLFISIFSWGILSASLATLIGYTIGIVIASSHFLKKDRMLHFVKPVLNKKTGILLLNGLPLAIASTLMVIRLLSTNHIILSHLGIVGISILSVCFNLLMISNMFIVGTVQTMQPIASVLYGAEDFKGVRLAILAALKTLAFCLFSLLLLLLLLPGLFTTLFGLSGTTLLIQAKVAIRLFALCLPFFGLNYLIMAVFQLSGRSNFSLIVSCTQGLLVIPIMLAAAFLNNETLIWLSFVMGEVLVLGIIWIISRTVRRKQPQLAPITLISAPPSEEVILDFSIQSSITKIKEFTETIHHFLQENNINTHSRNAIEICSEELISTIMNQGQSNKKTNYIDIRLNLKSHKAVLSITDAGIPFDPVKYDTKCSNIHYSRTLNQNVVVVEFEIQKIIP